MYRCGRIKPFGNGIRNGKELVEISGVVVWSILILRTFENVPGVYLVSMSPSTSVGGQWPARNDDNPQDSLTTHDYYWLIHSYFWDGLQHLITTNLMTCLKADWETFDSQHDTGETCTKDRSWGKTIWGVTLLHLPFLTAGTHERDSSAHKNIKQPVFLRQFVDVQHNFRTVDSQQFHTACLV